MSKKIYFPTLLTIFSAIFYFLLTKQGLFFGGGDSMHYYEMSQFIYDSSLKTDDLVTSPLHFPPLTSVVAGFFSYIFESDLMSTFLLMNGILLIINNLLFYFLSKKVLKKELLAQIAATMFGLSYATMSCHVELSSEPLFIFLTLSAFYIFYDYQEKKVILVFPITSFRPFLANQDFFKPKIKQKIDTVGSFLIWNVEEN